MSDQVTGLITSQHEGRRQHALEVPVLHGTSRTVDHKSLEQLTHFGPSILLKDNTSLPQSLLGLRTDRSRELLLWLILGNILLDVICELIVVFIRTISESA